MVVGSGSSRKSSTDAAVEPQDGTTERDEVATTSPERTSIRAIDTAEYIADLTRELARMARETKLDLLASILEIARLEAHTSWKRLSSNSRQSRLGVEGP